MCEIYGSDVTITVRARIHKQILVIACNDVPKKKMAESHVYTAFCDLCYSTKGQFGNLVLLKQFSNGGVYDIRRYDMSINRHQLNVRNVFRLSLARS